MSATRAENTWIELHSLLAARDPRRETVLVGKTAVFAGFYMHGIEIPDLPTRVSVLATASYLSRLQTQFAPTQCQDDADLTLKLHRSGRVLTGSELTWKRAKPEALAFRARTSLKTSMGRLDLAGVTEAGLVDDNIDVPMLALPEALQIVAAKARQPELIANLTQLALEGELISEAQAEALAGKAYTQPDLLSL